MVLIASIFLRASPKVQGEFKSHTYLVMVLIATMTFTVFMTTFPPSIDKTRMGEDTGW